VSEFLVSIDVVRPAGTDDEAWAAVTARERERAGALRAAGTIARIWRVPGTRGNVGIWAAEDATALHAALESLPLFPYARIEVRPLALHYLEA